MRKFLESAPPQVDWFSSFSFFFLLALCKMGSHPDLHTYKLIVILQYDDHHDTSFGPSPYFQAHFPGSSFRTNVSGCVRPSSNFSKINDHFSCGCDVFQNLLIPSHPMERVSRFVLCQVLQHISVLWKHFMLKHFRMGWGYLIRPVPFTDLLAQFLLI